MLIIPWLLILHLHEMFAGPEYGTTEAAWKAVLNEADRRSEAHIRVRDNLNNEVITSIKNWQKDNFHKQVGRLMIYASYIL